MALNKKTTAPALMKETLYLEVHGNKDIPLMTWSVVYLYHYCDMTNYNVVTVDMGEKQCDESSSTNNKGSGRTHITSLPGNISCSSMKWSQLPDTVKSCELPVLVDANGLVHYTGLCTVIRKMVMLADTQYPLSNLSSLLGFKQTSLKACSEVSSWTKLCEIQAPKDIAEFLKKNNTSELLGTPSCIPQAVQNLEEILSRPVKMFNSVHRQQRIKKKGSISKVDVQSRTQNGSGGGIYKNTTANINDKRKYKQLHYGGEKLKHVGSSVAIGADKVDQNDPEVDENGKEVTLPMSKMSLDGDHTYIGLKTDGSSDITDIKQDDSSISEDLSSTQNGDTTSAMSEMSLGADDTDGGLETTKGASSDEPKSAATDTYDNLAQISAHLKENCTVLDSPTAQNNDLRQVHVPTDSIFTTNPNKLPMQSRNADESLPPLEHNFTEGPDMTLPDLILFPAIQIFLTTLHRFADSSEHFRTIPFVLRWYKTMIDVPRVLQTLALCGLSVLDIPSQIVTLDRTNHQKQDDHKAEFGKGTGRKAVKASVKRHLPSIMSKLHDHSIKIEFDNILRNTSLDWTRFHGDVNPCEDVNETRARNKRNQIESLVAAVHMIVKDRTCNIVDFCSGGGHVGIVLAYILPQCHITMIENKEESMRRAAGRVQRIGLQNVTLVQSNIDYFCGKFDIGVSLHACGVATDLVLNKCQLQKAAFVSSPCCYGGLQNTHLITYPRSQQFRDMGVTCEEYFIVGHAAEQTSWNFETEHSKRGKLCMGVIDTDRAFAAIEQGYYVHLCSLQPHSCSPKNNLLIGWPRDSKNMTG